MLIYIAYTYIQAHKNCVIVSAKGPILLDTRTLYGEMYLSLDQGLSGRLSQDYFG